MTTGEEKRRLRQSKIDHYLPMTYVEEVLVARRAAMRSAAAPHCALAQVPITAEMLPGGCRLYRLPRAGR